MDNNTETMTTIKISSYALWDHLGRLYEPDHDGDRYKHIDVPGAYLTVSREGDLTCTIELTTPALREFIADMEYQCELRMRDHRIATRLRIGRDAVAHSTS